jgi:hypothetical protein
LLFFKPLEDFMPSGLYPGQPQSYGLLGLDGWLKHLEELLGKKKGPWVQLNGQSIHVGIFDHSLDKCPVDIILIVKL